MPFLARVGRSERNSSLTGEKLSVVDCIADCVRFGIPQPTKASASLIRSKNKVAVAYLVVSWALAQGVAQVFPVFDARRDCWRSPN